MSDELRFGVYRLAADARPTLPERAVILTRPDLRVLARRRARRGKR